MSRPCSSRCAACTMISWSSSSGSARLEPPSPPLPPLLLNSPIMAALSPSPPPPPPPSPPPPPLMLPLPLQLPSPSQLLDPRATFETALLCRSFHLRASSRDSASCWASTSRRDLGGVTVGSAGDMYGPRCGTAATGGSSSSSPSMSIRRFSCSSGSSSGRRSCSGPHILPRRSMSFCFALRAQG